MRTCPTCDAVYADGVAVCPVDHTRTLNTVSLGAGEAASSPDSALIGTFAGGYRIERLLGSGGMGAVYLGVHPTLGKRAAIKVLLRGADASADTQRRFVDEARAIGALDSPHIVRIFDLARLVDGRNYILMELLEGESLSEMLRRRGVLPEAEAVAIAVQALDGLAVAHAAGLVHRDIKPGNIFIARERGTTIVKLLDFGIAKLRRAAGETLTGTGLMLGTPGFMAPEQSMGASRNVDGRADLYALGVVIFAAVAGRLPFDPMQRFERFLGQSSQLSADFAGVPMSAVVERVVARALERNPAARFESAADMRAALVEAAGEGLAEIPPPQAPELPRAESPLPAAPRPEPPARDAVATAAETPRRKAAVTAAETPRREAATTATARRPHRFALIAGVGAALCAVIVLVVGLSRRATVAFADESAAPVESAAPARPRRQCKGNDLEHCNELARHMRMGTAPAEVREAFGGVNVPALARGKALAMYSETCRRGSAAGCTGYAEMLWSGEGAWKDRALAVKKFTTACEGGDAAGCYGLGWARYKGKGAAKDVLLAARALEKGCQGDHARSCLVLGYIYGNTLGSAGSPKREDALYRKACTLGAGLGCFNIGIDHVNHQRAQKALPWFERGCKRGSSSACRWLRNLRAGLQDARSIGAIVPVTSGKRARRGQRVLARAKDGTWWLATVRQRRGNKWLVQWDSGGKHAWRPPKHVAPLPRPSLPAQDAAVLCRWKGGTRFWRGRVTKRSDSRVSVRYLDGSVADLGADDCVAGR